MVHGVMSVRREEGQCAFSPGLLGEILILYKYGKYVLILINFPYKNILVC